MIVKHKYISAPSKIGNKSINKQIAELLSLSKTGNNDGNKMNNSNSNLNLNFTHNVNCKGKDIEETKVDEMPNGKQDRRKRSQIFEKYDIIWDDERLQFVMNDYMLLKIWVSDPNFAVDPMHLERTYIIGVFAGHEFNTGALARKLLREGCKLSMFRADFPAVAAQTNPRYFQGIYRCYFYAHHTNIEGWYDPKALTREHIIHNNNNIIIIETFKYLCDEILQHTPTNDLNGASKTDNMQMQTIIQDTPRPIADLNAVLIETITNIEYMNLGGIKRTLQHGRTYANSYSRSRHSNHHTNHHQQRHGQAHGAATQDAGPTQWSQPT